MRSVRLALLAGLLLGPRSVAAAPLALAGGELRLGLGSLPAITLPIAPAEVTVSSEGSFTLPAGLVARTRAALPQSLFTGVPQISGLSVENVLNAPLDFDAVGGLGVGPLAGTMFVDVLQVFSLRLPLSVVGSPGATYRAGNGLSLQLFGQGWRSGTASVTGLDGRPPFSSPPTVVFHGSDARSAGHAGDLLLVSPVKVLTNVIGDTAGFAILELRFAPEPRSLALAAAALLCVVWVARRERRRRAQAASSPNCSS